METLATTRPVRFAADCQSVAPSVTTLLLRQIAASSGPESENSPAVDNQYDAEESLADGLSTQASAVLELWIDLLGLCLLAFCTVTEDRQQDAAEQRNSQEESDCDDDDSDTDSEDEGEPLNHDLSSGRARSGWVTRWIRRAGKGRASEEPPGCPFDFGSDGRDADVPVGLAGLISGRVKVKGVSGRFFMPLTRRAGCPRLRQIGLCDV